jgi:hypothetical protein
MVTYHKLFSVPFRVLLSVSSRYCFATLVLHDVPYDCAHSPPPVVRPASQKDAQSSTCTCSHLFTSHMSPHDSSCICFRLPPIQTTRSSAHFTYFLYKPYVSVARSLVRRSIRISPSPFPYLQYSAPDGDTVRKTPQPLLFPPSQQPLPHPVVSMKFQVPPSLSGACDSLKMITSLLEQRFVVISIHCSRGRQSNFECRLGTQET